MSSSSHFIARSILGVMATAVLLFSPTLSQARKTGKKVPPLPPEVLMAKSVYLDCRGGPETPSLVKQEIEIWGRFRIENRPEDADLVLSIGGVSEFTFTNILYVSDRKYRRVFWSTTARGPDPDTNCVELIRLFRQRIEADEARQGKAQRTPKQP